jgi:hypothetical protein
MSDRRESQFVKTHCHVHDDVVEERADDAAHNLDQEIDFGGNLEVLPKFEIRKEVDALNRGLSAVERAIPRENKRTAEVQWRTAGCTCWPRDRRAPCS